MEDSGDPKDDSFQRDMGNWINGVTANMSRMKGNIEGAMNDNVVLEKRELMDSMQRREKGMKREKKGSRYSQVGA